MFRVCFCFTLIFFCLTFTFGQSFATISTAKASLRSEPNQDAKIVATVNQGDSLELIEKRETWYLVKTATHSGWVHADFIKLPPEKKYDRWGDADSKYDVRETGPGTGTGRGTGTGSGTGRGDAAATVTTDTKPDPIKNDSRSTPLKILSKPKPAYTNIAKANNIQGSVKLKITFLSSGKIGTIIPVTRLPHGLTDQAVEAAKRIRFEPMKVNGIPQTITRSVEYSFNLY